MERTIIVLMDTHSPCWRLSCSSSLFRSSVDIDPSRHFRPIREVSFEPFLQLDYILIVSDTKTNVQTYVTMEQIKIWLERKQIGMS